METIVMIIIAASLIYLFEYRRTSKPIELEVKHEDERLPHEIFPQLLYWKAGDIIVRKQLYSEHEFLGVLEGKIVLKSSSQGIHYLRFPQKKPLKVVITGEQRQKCYKIKNEL